MWPLKEKTEAVALSTSVGLASVLPLSTFLSISIVSVKKTQAGYCLLGRRYSLPRNIFQYLVLCRNTPTARRLSKHTAQVSRPSPHPSPHPCPPTLPPPPTHLSSTLHQLQILHRNYFEQDRSLHRARRCRCDYFSKGYDV